MPNSFAEMSDSESWATLVSAIKRAATDKGYTLERVPGRGRSNVWEVTTSAGERHRASFRTTRDRWFTFQPLNGGARWKTLEDVDLVFVAAVDDRDDPTNIEVYKLTAAEVRDRFDRAYAARAAEGRIPRDGFGMWVNLDLDHRGIASSVGSGLAHDHDPIAIYPVASLLEAGVEEGEDEEARDDDGPAVDRPEAVPGTIGQVLDRAHGVIASLAGVPRDKVKLDLRIELP
jgi:hypothetical protein